MKTPKDSREVSEISRKDGLKNMTLFSKSFCDSLQNDLQVGRIEYMFFESEKILNTISSGTKAKKIRHLFKNDFCLYIAQCIDLFK